MDYRAYMREAEQFAQDHLGVLAQEVRAERQGRPHARGRLPELAALCDRYCPGASPEEEARHLVMRLALDKACNVAPTVEAGEPRYRMSLSESQLELLGNACEIVARIEMNQLDMVADVLAARCGAEPEVAGDVRETLAQAQRALARLLPARKAGGPLTRGDRYWDMYEVFRHRLAWDRAYRQGLLRPGEPRRWPEMMRVDFDLPRPRSPDTLPVIETEHQEGG